MRRLSLPRRLYDGLTDRWLLATFVLSLPSLIYAVLQIAGQDLGLVAAQGRLTKWGHALFWPVLGASTVFYALKARADRYVEKLRRDGQFLHRRLLDATTAITKAKLNRFCVFISAQRGHAKAPPFEEITQPKRQMKRILDSLEGTLSELCGLSQHELGTSLAIRRGGNGSWEWIHSPSVDNELDLAQLVGDGRSSFSQVVTGSSSSVIHADKADAAARGVYLPSARDKAFNGVGSLVCRRLAVLAPDECVTAVLSVSSYGKQLFELGDEDTERKLATIVLPPFELRLRLELALLYIKENAVG